MWIVKGIIYVGILCYTALYDRKHHEIPDWVHRIIFITGFIRCDIYLSIAGAVLIPIPFLIAGLNGRMGGGDVKFMAANGFFLGLYGGLTAGIIGLLLAVVIHWKSIRKQEEKAVALAPYLSIGCFLVLILSG